MNSSQATYHSERIAVQLKTRDEVSLLCNANRNPEDSFLNGDVCTGCGRTE